MSIGIERTAMAYLGLVFGSRSIGSDRMWYRFL